MDGVPGARAARRSSMSGRIGRHLLAALAGVAIGSAIAAGVAYLTARYESAVVFSDVRAVATLRTRHHELWLAVHYHVYRHRACPSWSQHAIFRDNTVHGMQVRNYVPLGITANGLGAQPYVNDFDISFRLPHDLLPGRWWYTVTTSASCQWLPGLTRDVLSQTVPVPITIPKDY